MAKHYANVTGPQSSYVSRPERTYCRNQADIGVYCRKLIGAGDSAFKMGRFDEAEELYITANKALAELVKLNNMRRIAHEAAVKAAIE